MSIVERPVPKILIQNDTPSKQTVLTSCILNCCYQKQWSYTTHPAKLPCKTPFPPKGKFCETLPFKIETLPKAKMAGLYVKPKRREIYILKRKKKGGNSTHEILGEIVF